MEVALLLNLSFLLFAITTNIPLALSAVERVVATDGQPIFTLGEYYILPAVGGSEGGGLRFGQAGRSACPVAVMQDYSAIFSGLPVKFTTPDFEPPIFTDSPLRTVTFSYRGTNCVISFNTEWPWVVVDDSPQPWLSIGLAQDHPGKQILDGKFHIQRSNRGYKLVFCLTSGACKHIGRQNDNHGKRLVLTDKDPFQFVFVNTTSLV